LVVVITDPVALARPAERPPANLAAANPHERLVGWKGIGILVIVDEKLMTVVIAGVAKPLHRLVLEQSLLIAEPAKFQLVGPDVLGEIAGRHSGRSGFEHEHAEATLGDLLGDPAAARTRPDDEHVIRHSVHQTPGAA